LLDLEQVDRLWRVSQEGGAGMTIKFLHTSDWQLGVTRHFLSPGAQDRWAAARNEAVTALCKLATDENCDFIVVAGDVFESNHVSRATVLTAIEALKNCRLPIFLLPGNHDCLEPTNVYDSNLWQRYKPPNVHVLTIPGQCVEVKPGVEVVGAPWLSKRPTSDLVAETAKLLEPLPHGFRVLVGHGAVSTLSPNPDNPAIINVEASRQALQEKRIHYLALGDRHSTTNVTGESDGRIWYSGTPEAFDFVETDNGNVLVVETGDLTVTVTPRRVGSWKFVVHEEVLNNQQDLDALVSAVEGLPDKPKTMLKLGLTGALGMTQKIALEQFLDQLGDLFAAVLMSASRTDLVVVPSEADFSELRLSGYGAKALEVLRGKLAAGVDRDAAGDALALLFRLQGGST
jgi:DNA repair exonuclease SbcCD nuclease subunit